MSKTLCVIFTDDGRGLTLLQKSPGIAKTFPDDASEDGIYRGVRKLALSVKFPVRKRTKYYIARILDVTDAAV